MSACTSCDGVKVFGTDSVLRFDWSSVCISVGCEPSSRFGWCFVFLYVVDLSLGNHGLGSF